MADASGAIICDTGALLDYLVAGASDHRLFRNAIDRARTRYVPALVLAEVDYFLRNERPAMRRFVRDLRRGAFTYAPVRIDHIPRAMEIDERYADLRLGLVDSSIIALAEDLGLTRHCDARRPSIHGRQTTRWACVRTGRPSDRSR